MCHYINFQLISIFLSLDWNCWLPEWIVIVIFFITWRSNVLKISLFGNEMKTCLQSEFWVVGATDYVFYTRVCLILNYKVLVKHSVEIWFGVGNDEQRMVSLISFPCNVLHNSAQDLFFLCNESQWFVQLMCVKQNVMMNSWLCKTKCQRRKGH